MKKRLYQALLGLVLSASVAAGGFFAAVPQTAYAQNVATDSESGYHLADNVQDGVILHCFDWTYQQIIDECKFCSNGTLILKSAVHLF